jgi:hypothetical protein
MNKSLIVPLLTFFFIYTPHLKAKEFLNTVLHINFGVSYGIPEGDIIDYESEKYYINETYDGETTQKYPEHYSNSYGMTLDITPFDPILLANEAHAVKIGARASYKFHYIEQNITVADAEQKEVDYGGSLFRYQAWMVGPVLHYSPMVETSEITGDYTSKGGFTLFLLYGKLVGSQLTIMPSKRDFGDTVSNYKTSMTGYKIDAGLGGEVSVCSVNLGLNLIYSYMSFNTAEKLYDSISRESTMSQISVEVYMGIPVEWYTMPAIF